MAAVGPNYQTVSGKSEWGNFWELEIKERFIIHIERRVWFSRRKSEIIYHRTIAQNPTKLPLTRGAFSGGSRRENPMASPQPLKGRKHPPVWMQRSCGYTGEFTGGRLYDSAHDYLWLFESEPPKARVAYQRRSRRSSEGWSSVKARVLVADKPTRRGALGSFLSACLPPFFLIHTHSLSRTNTPTHTLDVPPAYLSEEREPPSPTAQSFSAFFPSLYLLAVIYLGDGIRAAPNANML